MSDDIGFGVIGLGMGKHHCMAVDKAPGARLAGVCDVDEERLNPVAEISVVLQIVYSLERLRRRGKVSGRRSSVPRPA